VADSIREARQRLSASLFNNMYLADVVLQIAALARTSDQFVTTRKIAAASGLGDSLVRPVVMRLEEGGFLRRLPRMGGRRSEQYFARSTSTAWRTLVRLCRSLDDEGSQTTDAEVGHRSLRADS
jgi:hypothetical protein